MVKEVPSFNPGKARTAAVLACIGMVFLMITFAYLRGHGHRTANPLGPDEILYGMPTDLCLALALLLGAFAALLSVKGVFLKLVMSQVGVGLAYYLINNSWGFYARYGPYPTFFYIKAFTYPLFIGLSAYLLHLFMEDRLAILRKQAEDNKDQTGPPDR